MENIAKLTSYGCYLDCDFETAKYPDDKIHIVGLLAEYVYDLEQRILHYDERYAKLWHEIETLRECVSKESDQEQKISDLEAKLAESESKVAVGRFWHSAYEGKQLDYDKLNNDYNKQEKLLSEVLADKSKLQFEFDQLKQQLEEKEKEIENIKLCRCVNCTNEYEFMLEGLVEDLEKQIDKDNQDKISFAVEQLEKVKGSVQAFDGIELMGFIDNQIKQLKETT